MLNVMIVDDEPPARARLGQVLRDCSQQVSLQLIGEAEGGIRGLEEADRLRPDVVLLDVNMICLREHLWGKAKGYLQDSLSDAKHPATYLALARLAEAVGLEAEAAQQYREAALGYGNLPPVVTDSAIAGLRAGMPPNNRLNCTAKAKKP